MAKGKKNVIKEIKKLNDEEVMINGKEYVLLESSSDIEKAITMKISSNGNRILRFDDEKKTVKIDVKRDINIIKVTIIDAQRASKYKKSHDKSLITNQDGKKVIDIATSFIKARKIVESYVSKNGENYDPLSGKNTFYYFEEVK